MAGRQVWRARVYTFGDGFAGKDDMYYEHKWDQLGER
jgi:hypothetical protein